MTALARQEQRMTSLEEMQAFADVAVRSRFYGFKTADEMLPLMIIAQSQGRSFTSVVEEYSVINGRPALKSESMLARFQKAGGHIKWTELSDKRCAAIFSHPQCDPVEVDWDLERAKAAGLAGRDMWKKFPRNMLKARVISDGVRTAYPACLGGVYTPEEVSDMEPARPQVSPPQARGQLAAPEEPGQVEPPREPPSLKHSFTGDSEGDGLPKGKSAHAARKNGDWQRVSERLDEELKDCATKGEAVMWWEKVRTTDEEYQALPQDWRKTYRDEHYLPVLAGLDDEAEVVEWEEAGARG
jgi:hypothetical protein